MQNPLIKYYRSYLISVKHLQSATVANRVLEISKFLLFVGNQQNFKVFETVDFNSYLSGRYAGKCYKRSYTNKIVSCLQCFYDFLQTEGFISHNPAVALDKSQAEKTLPDVLSMHEYHLLLQAFDSSAKDMRDQALIETLFSTGMRISECLCIEKRTAGDGITINGKGGVEKLKIINQAAQVKINRWLKVSPASAWLFCNNRGKRLTRQYVNKMLREKSRAAGITKKVSPHSFRHFFATMLLEGGANLFEVQNLLGHASVSSTEIYTKISVNHLRTEMRYHPRW